MRPAILQGAMRIPVEHIDVGRVKTQLTYSVQPLAEEEPVEVQGYYVDGDFLCVPRQFGLRLCSQLQIPFEDETSQGEEVIFPQVPDPRDYQIQPLEEIKEAFTDSYDVVFRAHTGWGKTIGSLLVAAWSGQTVLIVVDQENLKDQWLEVLTDPKLFGFQPDEIGEIQGPRCDYKGKAVTIAMVQTLSQRTLPADAYDYFGFVIWDEFHVFGAPTFQLVLMQFSATYRLGVSATPRRRDALQKALDNNMGKVRVAADKEHNESAVYILRNPTVYSFYGNVSKMTGRIISEVVDDGDRNMMLVDVILRLYETGRDVLVLSERVEHLQMIADMMHYLGVPDEEVGMYTGYTPQWRLQKDATPKKLPRGIHREWDGEKQCYVSAPFTPVTFAVKQKKTPKAVLAAILKSCGIVLATYGKFTKGVDAPRLAAGVDITPRSQAEQAQGRILREQRDKLQPIWVTVVDEQNYRFHHSFLQRAKDYDINNSLFYEWDGEEDLQPCELSELREDAREMQAFLQNEKEIAHDKETGYWKLVPKGTERRAQERAKAQESKSTFRKITGKAGSRTSPSGAEKEKSLPRVKRSRL